MRLVSWNCQGAFRKKRQHAAELRPDILVVAECEKSTQDQSELFGPSPSSSHWISDIPSKGLAVLTFGDFKAEIAPFHDPTHTYVLPLLVSGPLEFLLLAVWTVPVQGSYARPICCAIEAYKSEMRSRTTVLAGDFNGHPMWDKPSAPYSFSKGAQALSEMEIRSVYHHDLGVEHGQEEQPTFFLYRHPDKSYHIDYVFASKDLLVAKHSIEIGKAEYWLQHSDHLPLIFDVSCD